MREIYPNLPLSEDQARFLSSQGRWSFRGISEGGEGAIIISPKFPVLMRTPLLWYVKKISAFLHSVAHSQAIILFFLLALVFNAHPQWSSLSPPNRSKPRVCGSMRRPTNISFSRGIGENCARAGELPVVAHATWTHTTVWSCLTPQPELPRHV